MRHKALVLIFFLAPTTVSFAARARRTSITTREGEAALGHGSNGSAPHRCYVRQSIGAGDGLLGFRAIFESS
jgi:hypothetical protein